MDRSQHQIKTPQEILVTRLIGDPQKSGNIPGGGNELQIDTPQDELTQIGMRSRRLKRPP